MENYERNLIEYSQFPRNQKVIFDSLDVNAHHIISNPDTVFAISISGGKDSQALLNAFMFFYCKMGLTNKVFAIHSDLGRFEWPQTLEHCKKLAEHWSIDLVVVRREREGKEMDLLDRIEQRKTQLEGTGKPFWPSAMARYCTSDMKAEPINKYLRQFKKVISLEGIRWDESKARSMKEVFTVRESLATKSREAYTWNAIAHFTEEDVWATETNMNSKALANYREYYQKTGKVVKLFPFHPAYAMGNTRLSCAICILANKNDFHNGIKHNPTLAKQLAMMEQESGFTFKQGQSITDVLNNNQTNLFQ